MIGNSEKGSKLYLFSIVLVAVIGGLLFGIDQKLLAKMAGVTRQTVARWEQMGFISRSDVGLSRDKYFQIKEVISQLEKLKE